ncbi:MAG: hypothetical protein K0R39_5193, partial [Symbiobacteriaceae bacterium]|nr:hypothetical protein [Symbiobacteriaceae bacterium]
YLLRITPELPTNHMVFFSVMEELKLVSARPVPPGTPGASQIRYTPRPENIQENDVTMYLDGVFVDYPSLRVKGKRKVAVAFERDAENNPYLEINLASQLAMRTTKREGAAGEGEEDENLEEE